MWQNFCLPFLFSFIILFLLIEQSRIPFMENYRTWQHREKYIPNKGSKPSGFYLEKPVNILQNGFVIFFCILDENLWNCSFFWIFSMTVFKCLTHFKIENNIFLKQQFNIILLSTSSIRTFSSKSWRRLLV